jgi:hypothetical protein
MGGVSLSLADAATRYDSTADGLSNLALPRSSAAVEGWSRFLRYERILSPVVLLPKAVALEPLDLMPQSGVRAILRTIQVGDICKECGKEKAGCVCEYGDRETASTWRVILPPQVSLDEAVRHGGFDRLAKVGAVAPGDLLAVDYDTSIGERAIGRINPQEDQGLGRKNGFPAVKRTTPTSPGSKPAFEDYFNVHDKPTTVENRSRTGHQYYADPMAEYLVIALRPNNQRPGEGYFDGPPKIIRVREKDGQILPVALNIERETTKRRSAPKQQDFWDKEIKQQKINGLRADGAATGGTVQAKVGTIRLRAGEVVAVDCWFIPSLEALRAYFGWPEALAIKAVAAIDNLPSDRTKFRELVISKLPKTLDDSGGRVALSSQDFLTKYENEPAWVGIAGMVADPAVIAAAAAILHRHMQFHPLPEIAAIRTIDAVHAVAKPPRAPQFIQSEELVVLRSPNNADGRLKVLTDYQNGQGLGSYGRQGDDGILFAGKIAMDRDVCRQLEVVAHCTSPARGALDDIRLGRTELQRLLGEWPNRVVPEAAGAANGKLVDSQKVRLTRRARHLFGFDVDEEGTVYLPKQEVTLLQLDDLAERADDSKFADLETIDLVAETIGSLKRTKSRDEGKLDAVSLARGAMRAAPLDAYTDRHARKIVVSLRATTRFDPYFIRLNPKVAVSSRSPLPETMFPPIPEQVELIRARSYHGELPSFDDQNSRKLEKAEDRRSQLRVMWIPATIAPAKPQVHTVLPSYFIIRPDEKGAFPPGEATQPRVKLPKESGANERYWCFNRKPSVRIMLDRPWYSSGEGERLGVILWPPQLREIGTEPADEAQLQRGEIFRFVLHTNSRRSDSDPKSGLMQLHDFQDEDLGSGGKFTTRWGADPTRENSGPMGPFLRPNALLDVIDNRDPSPKDDSVGYVPSVTIPLRDLREEEEKQLKDGGPKEPSTAYETITAALATYVPRFDVESEKWFVDIALNSDRVVEPFVRFGLVRYQAEARKELRASAPVRTWAQVLPERTVQVWLSKSIEDPDTRIIVQVSGNTSARSASDTGEGELAYPKFRVSVVEVADVISGGNKERTAVARRILRNQDGVEEKSEIPTTGFMPAVAWASASPPDRKGLRDSPSTSRTTFFLPVKTDEQGRPKRRKLAVLVEEVEDYRSTANDDASPAVTSDSAETEAGTAVAGSSRNAKPDSVTPPGAKSTRDNTTKPRIAEQVPMQVLDAVFDLDPIAGDEVDSGISRTGPRFLARIDVDYDETISMVDEKELRSRKSAG